MEVQTKEKQPDRAWVRKTPEKILAFNVGREKATFMEDKKDFASSRTSVATTQKNH